MHFYKALHHRLAKDSVLPFVRQKNNSPNSNSVKTNSQNVGRLAKKRRSTRQNWFYLFFIICKI